MAKEKNSLGMKAKTRISNGIIYLILVAMSIVWLAPFVCIVLQSFRVEKTGQVGYVIPKQWGLQNYINLFDPEICDFSLWFKNTLIISLVVAVVNTLMVL